jgi:hypothetical protein
MNSGLARELRDYLRNIEQTIPEERVERAKETLLWMKTDVLPTSNREDNSMATQAIALAMAAIAGFLNEPKNDFRNGCMLGKAIISCEWVATNKEILEGVTSFLSTT